MSDYKARLEAMNIAASISKPSWTEHDLFKATDQILSYLQQTDIVKSNVWKLKESVPSEFLDQLQDDVWKHRKETFDFMDSNPLVFIRSARQMGVTSALISYALYSAITNNGIEVDFVTSNNTNARMALAYCTGFIETLNKKDRLIKAVGSGDNDAIFRHHMKINDSIIRFGSGQTMNMIRTDMLIIDNAGYIPNKQTEPLIDRFDHMYPRLCKKVIIATTGKATESNLAVFARDFFRSKALPWYEHPKRNDEWSEAMVANIGVSNFHNDYEVQ